MFQYDYNTLTPSGGVGTASLVFKNGKLQNIFVQATTATTTFDVQIIDHNNLIIRNWKSNIGKLSQSDIGEIMIGDITFKILNADTDELFTYLLKYDVD